MITKDVLDRVLSSITTLTKRQVLVGVPSDRAYRNPETGETEPASNALIGYAMEFGLPDQNVPARPFLVPGVESARDTVVAQLRKGAVAASSPTTSVNGHETAEKALAAAGMVAQAAVRAKITAGPFVPLAPSTIAQRRARGRTGTRPLIDTAQLRNSITFVVRES